MGSGLRVLALGAHPDDVEIYMFGALSAWSVAGATVTIAIATDGAKGGTGDPAEMSRTRKREAAEAAALLGVAPRFLDFPDGALVPDAGLVGGLKGLIGEVLPDIIVTHAGNDYHGDHRALSEAVGIAASFTAPVIHADNLRGVGFAPTHYVDITAHAEMKARAIRAHASQDPERFVVATGLLNRFRAAQANGGETEQAEAYRFEPIFPFVDIRALLPPAPQVRPVRNRNIAT
ncbi:N-acetylglucosaminyl deacetylase, LmbE family [Devosia enhydra]|uniref:N-acetylglucosaminyl deacetylase, LmbE family n=1 Tax=Devosia enhydra TaxID=665118 RepID=A0A1K2I0V8_9HYPH|nr:N-acetylglucosaminyl deacetylase, LmbE family [Devosia enhydra]